MPYHHTPRATPARAQRLLLALLFLLCALPLLGACTAFNAAGIGGPPTLQCARRTGTAFLDDRLVGSDATHLAVLRRMPDADELCAKAPPATTPVKEARP